MDFSNLTQGIHLNTPGFAQLQNVFLSVDYNVMKLSRYLVHIFNKNQMPISR